MTRLRPTSKKKRAVRVAAVATPAPPTAKVLLQRLRASALSRPVALFGGPSCGCGEGDMTDAERLASLAACPHGGPQPTEEKTQVAEFVAEVEHAIETAALKRPANRYVSERANALARVLRPPHYKLPLGRPALYRDEDVLQAAEAYLREDPKSRSWKTATYWLADALVRSPSSIEKSFHEAREARRRRKK